MSYYEASRIYQNRYLEREQHPNHSAIRYIEQRVRQGHLSRRTHHEYNKDDVRVFIFLAAIHLNSHTSSRVMVRELAFRKNDLKNFEKSGVSSFSRIIYHYYSKMLIFIHDRKCGYN